RGRSRGRRATAPGSSSGPARRAPSHRLRANAGTHRSQRRTAPRKWDLLVRRAWSSHPVRRRARRPLIPGVARTRTYREAASSSRSFRCPGRYAVDAGTRLAGPRSNVAGVNLIEIQTPDGPAEAYLTGSGPGVLFFIDAFGVRPQIAEMAG